MDLQRYIKIYERDLRKIEEAFDEFEQIKGRKELDTETIEEILLDWEEFMSELREENDEDFDDLADEIYEQIEEFQTKLDEYEKKRAAFEEKEALKIASERLKRSTIENYLEYQAKPSQATNDVSRYDKAMCRFINPLEEMPEKKNRLELDES